LRGFWWKGNRRGKEPYYTSMIALEKKKLKKPELPIDLQGNNRTNELQLESDWRHYLTTLVLFATVSK